MHQYAIAAMGADQPGIVARIGEALLDADASIVDSSMTILGGHFAMLLLVHTEQPIDALREQLVAAASSVGMSIELHAAGERALAPAERDDYVVAAYGPDRQGLVATLSRVLADAGANITDFGSRVGADGTFAMWFNISITADTDTTVLAARLGEAGAAFDLDVRLYRADAEEL
jgi:glycine cleavage system transcriptional repressor